MASEWRVACKSKYQILKAIKTLAIYPAVISYSIMLGVCMFVCVCVELGACPRVGTPCCGLHVWKPEDNL